MNVPFFQVSISTIVISIKLLQPLVRVLFLYISFFQQGYDERFAVAVLRQPAPAVPGRGFRE